ncbi:reverse transcriptase domain-containing protein [Tanacetum coccineum]
MKCVCNMWQLSRIPCVHVMAGYMHMKMNLDLGVVEWYSQCKWYVEFISEPQSHDYRPGPEIISLEQVCGKIQPCQIQTRRQLRHRSFESVCSRSLGIDSNDYLLQGCSPLEIEFVIFVALRSTQVEVSVAQPKGSLNSDHPGKCLHSEERFVWIKAAPRAIMPPRMMTRGACRSTVAPRGRGMGGRVGRKVRGTREPVRRNNETIGELDGQGNDRGVGANGGVDGVPDFFTIIAQQL